MKLVYNLELQGGPVGAQDATTLCPEGGTAHVYGTATSNADQGATMLDLSYELTRCSYRQRDDKAAENYALTLDGVVTQRGTLAVQPSTTTALEIGCFSLAIDGTVYDPPVDYHEPACLVAVAQNGNRLSGSWCGRIAGVDL